MLKEPLIDPKTSPEKLGAWIDAHCMDVHSRIKEARPALREGGAAGWAFTLNSSYGRELLSVPRGS